MEGGGWRAAEGTGTGYGRGKGDYDVAKIRLMPFDRVENGVPL